MVDAAIGYIELCRNVMLAAKTVYDVSKKILTNFQEQKALLMEKVDFLRNRVKLLQKKLEKDGEESGDDMDGLKEVLTKIQELFFDITTFLERVSGYRCRKALQFIKVFLQEYREIQKLFTRYSVQLHQLKENLNDMILDALFLGMGSFDMQKQLQKACTDLKKDFQRFRNVLTKAEEHGSFNMAPCNALLPVPQAPGSLGGNSSGRHHGAFCRMLCCSCFRTKRKKPKSPKRHFHLEPKVQEAVQVLDDYEKTLYRELSEELSRSIM